MILNQDVYFDAIYDVIILGFGGAGATAARFAAESGAKVLLVDSAPKGKEGGNTKYFGHLVDFKILRKSYNNLVCPFNLSWKAFQATINNVLEIGDLYPTTVKNEKTKFKKYDVFKNSQTKKNAALWNSLKQNVLKRTSKINIWYESIPKYIIKDPEGKSVIGVQIEKNYVIRNIRAKNGIILATGGFENNPDMVKNFIGKTKFIVRDSLYNKGQGIKLSNELKAKMWHMNKYNSVNLLQNLPFFNSNIGNFSLVSSSILHSYMNKGLKIENKINSKSRKPQLELQNIFKFSNLFNFVSQKKQKQVYLVLGIKVYKEFKQIINSQNEKPPSFIIKINTLTELAKYFNLKPDKLRESLAKFNLNSKKNIKHILGKLSKNSQFLGKQGPYYVIPIFQILLNTLGGPKRNNKTEVLDSENQIIPHLYAAGELGSYFSNFGPEIQGLGDCLISGKIAGKNAAKTKNDKYSKMWASEDLIPDAQTSPTQNLNY